MLKYNANNRQFSFRRNAFQVASYKNCLHLKDKKSPKTNKTFKVKQVIISMRKIAFKDKKDYCKT